MRFYAFDGESVGRNIRINLIFELVFAVSAEFELVGNNSGFAVENNFASFISLNGGGEEDGAVIAAFKIFIVELVELAGYADNSVIHKFKGLVNDFDGLAAFGLEEFPDDPVAVASDFAGFAGDKHPIGFIGVLIIVRRIGNYRGKYIRRVGNSNRSIVFKCKLLVSAHDHLITLEFGNRRNDLRVGFLDRSAPRLLLNNFRKRGKHCACKKQKHCH